MCRANFQALVVKASGLAAGKGVVVASTKQEAADAAREMLEDHKFGSAGNVVVVEELLEGPEVSVSLSMSSRNCINPFNLIDMVLFLHNFIFYI